MVTEYRDAHRVGLVAGTGNYEGALPTLQQMPAMLIHVTQALTADFTVASLVGPAAPELLTRAHEWLDDARRAGTREGRETRAVIYYAGHGTVREPSSELHLHAAPLDGAPTSFRFIELYDEAVGSGVDQIVLLIDACHSGQAFEAVKVAELLAFAKRDSPPTSVYVITSASPAGFASQGTFAETLNAVLLSPAVPKTQKFIAPEQVAAQIRRRIGTHSAVHHSERSTGWAFFVNPGFQERPEWFQIEAGVPGWQFCGRKEAVRALVDGLPATAPGGGESGPGLAVRRTPFVVTGGAGSGKSTLLRWVTSVALGRPLPSDRRPGTAAQEIPAGLVHQYVDCREQTEYDIRHTLFGHDDGSDPVERMVRRLRTDRPGTGGAAPVRVVLDGVDESGEPQRIWQLAGELSAETSVDVVVSLNSTGQLDLGRAADLDLDDQRWRDDEAPTDLIRSLLRAAWAGISSSASVEAAVDAVRSAAGGSLFSAYVFARHVAEHGVAAVPQVRELAPALALHRLELAWGVRTRGLEPNQLLAPLACALGWGVPDADLWLAVLEDLFATELPDEDLLELVESAPDVVDHVVGPDGAAGWRLQSPALAAVITRSLDVPAVHAAFARHLRTALLEDGAPPARRTYARLHLAEHLRRAGGLHEGLRDPRLLLALDQVRLRRALERETGPDSLALKSVSERLEEPGRPRADLFGLTLLAGAFRCRELEENGRQLLTGPPPDWLVNKPSDRVAVGGTAQGDVLVLVDEDDVPYLGRLSGTGPQWSRIEVPPGRGSRVTCVQIVEHPSEGGAVLLGFGDGTLAVVRRTGTEEIARYGERVQGVRSAGSLIVVTAQRRIVWWDMGDADSVPETRDFDRLVGADVLLPVTGSPTGGELLVVGQVDRVVVLDRRGRVQDHWPVTPAPLMDLRVVDGTVLTCHGNGQVWATSLRNRGPAQRVADHTPGRPHLAVGRTPRGPVLVTCGADRRLLVTELRAAGTPASSFDIPFPLDIRDLAVDGDGHVHVSTPQGLARIHIDGPGGRPAPRPAAAPASRNREMIR